MVTVAEMSKFIADMSPLDRLLFEEDDTGLATTQLAQLRADLAKAQAELAEARDTIHARNERLKEIGTLTVQAAILIKNRDDGHYHEFSFDEWLVRYNEAFAHPAPEKKK